MTIIAQMEIGVLPVILAILRWEALLFLRLMLMLLPEIGLRPTDPNVALTTDQSVVY
jgi:hypothetical protein